MCLFSPFKCHKIDLNRGGSYIDSFDWIKSKRATIYPVNDDDKYFQSTATVTLNNERNRKQIAKNIKKKPFINKYNWKEIGYQWEEESSNCS